MAGWRRDRPPRKGRRGFNPASIEPVGPYEWLAEDTGLPVEVVKAARWPNRRATTELYVADAIIASVGGDTGMLQRGGPLEPRPNPAAPPERQRECCGGSTVAARFEPWSLTGSGR